MRNNGETCDWWWTESIFFCFFTEFDFRVVSQQYVLSLDIPVDNFIAMKITKSPQYFSRDIGYPFLLQALALGRLDEIRDGAGTAILHNQPQLIVFTGRWLLYEGTVIRGYIPMIRVLQYKGSFALIYSANDPPLYIRCAATRCQHSPVWVHLFPT